MLSRDFAFWLQGYLELAPHGPLSTEQVDMIRRHLRLVFIHEIDPTMQVPAKSAHEGKLDAAHGPTPAWPHGPQMRC